MNFIRSGDMRDLSALDIGLSVLFAFAVVAGIIYIIAKNRGKLDRYVAAKSLRKNIEDSNNQLLSLTGAIENLLEDHRKNPQNLPERLEDLDRSLAYVKWDKESVSRFANVVPHSFFHDTPDIYCRALCNANNFYDFYESYKNIYFTFMDKLNTDIIEYCKCLPYEDNHMRKNYDALTTATIKLDAEKAMRIYEKILLSLRIERDKASELVRDLDKLIKDNS